MPSCSYGYDPLGLGKDTETVAKYRAFELIHARWAMLAAAGIVIPEGLQANGAPIVGGTWFETGAEMLNGGTLNYFAVPWGIVNNPLPLFAVIAVEVGLMGAVEFYRKNGTGPAGYSPGEQLCLAAAYAVAVAAGCASDCMLGMQTGGLAEACTFCNIYAIRLAPVKHFLAFSMASVPSTGLAVWLII